MKKSLVWLVLFLGSLWFLMEGNSDLLFVALGLFSGAALIYTRAGADPQDKGPLCKTEVAARVMLALIFLYHGFPKVMAMGENPMSVNKNLWLLVGLAEVVGGFLMVIGPARFRKWGALFLVVVMAGALGMVHLRGGFSMMNGGFEYQLLLLLLAHSIYVGAGGYCPICAICGRLFGSGRRDCACSEKED